MRKFPLRRLAAAGLPLLLLIALYSAWVGLEYLFNFSPWVTRPLFLLTLLMFPVMAVNRFSTLRERTEQELAGHQQIVDEAVPVESDSGVMVLTDLGSLRSWRPAASFDEQLAELSAADVSLTGPKSWDVARKLGLSTPYVYDIPQPALAEFLAQFSAESAKFAPKLHVNVEPQRVPHLRRAQRALKNGPALFNIRDQELLAIGVKKASLVRSWLVDGTVDTIDIVTGDEPVTHTQLIGELHFRSNALVLADPVALESWNSLESRDGLYDLLLAGAPAELAAETGGVHLDKDVWCWNNLTLPETQKVAALFAMRDPETRVAINPHGDEYFLATQLALDPVGHRVFPEGSVHAFRLEGKESAVLSAGLSKDGSLVRVRMSFDVDPTKVFFLPPPSRFEHSVKAVKAKLKRLKFPRKHGKR